MSKAADMAEQALTEREKVLRGLAYDIMADPNLFGDSAQVTIGSRVAIAPNVNIYASGHSSDVVERRTCLVRAYPVTMHDDLRDGHVAEPGVSPLVNFTGLRIEVTIAAGSVVKGDFPDHVVIGGVPAKILKYLDPPPPLSE
ncbi:hypothetical protein BU17DRAFT_62048 [Hysterangium stoloniferum]|nr:hypothetical protein BU17DRAFT_62048 [Hysterangium stoloniferum]